MTSVCTTTPSAASPAMGMLRALPSRRNYECPSWCERTDHFADKVDAENLPLHYGPEFGPFEVNARGTGSPLAAIDVVTYSDMDATALRNLADDAQDAAAWLEQVQA